MAKKNRLQKVADKAAAETGHTGKLSKFEAAVLGLVGNKADESAYVSLKYYNPDYQCFSDWSAVELKSLSSFCTKIRNIKWSDIYRTGGKPGDKVGFGYTVHKDRNNLPEHPELDKLSEDLTWFELRVNQSARVHGFRAKDAFFLVFLDVGHKIYPM
jgi:hypothetical protein